jgi:chromosome segregation ATPase
MERKLNEKIQTLEQTLKRVRDESQKKYESEHEKVRNLKKEVNRLQKDNESKTQKIDRLEEYLQISKDISNNLQTEKKMLEAQIQNEKDMIRRLEALTESARKESEQNESVQYETQVASLTQELTQVRGQLEASEERLFLTTALSIKLNYWNDGIGSQLNNAELFERVKQQNIPRELWGKFIHDTMMAMHATEEPKSLPVTAGKSSPSHRGKSAKNNNNVRTIAKRM